MNHAKPFDPRTGLRGFLMLDLIVRLHIWGGAMAIAIASFTRLDRWPSHAFIGSDLGGAWSWAWTLIQWVFLYNATYVLILILIRLPIPTPKEGRYRLIPGKIPDKQLIWSCFIAILTKARYEAPFPGFLVFHLANLPPLCWLMGPIFGPRSRSCYVTDPQIMDPHLIEIGRNVVLGYRCLISAHTQGRDEIVIKKTVIEDDVLIGGDALIYGGCHIKRGSVILGGAIVIPDTVIGENEVWGGIPAKRIKTLPPIGEAEDSSSAA